MSEDCLSINVFRPAGLNATAKLPVMVWVYGGSLLEGGSSLYDPTVLVGRSVQLVRVPKSDHVIRRRAEA